MKKFIDIKVFLIVAPLWLCAAWLLHRFSGLSLWVAVLIIVGAMLLNAVVAEIEDRLPGGFLHPKKQGTQSSEQQSPNNSSKRTR